MILAIGLMSLFIALAPLSVAQEAQESSVKSNVSDVASPLSVPESSPIEMRIVRLRGKHKGYTVDVRYPQFRGGSRAAIRKLNREVKLVVDRNIAALPGTPDNNFTYSCQFTKCLVTPRLVSLNFEFSSYVGGAHDGKTEVPLNAQIYPQFKLLKLKDVLGRKVNYSKLSELYQNELQFQRAIYLRPKYFSNFTVAKDGLTVRLPQGEFTAEAAECPSATITYKKLNQKRLIAKNSPIWYLAEKNQHRTKKQSRSAKPKTSF
jgi:hypothetical protein